MMAVALLTLLGSEVRQPLLQQAVHGRDDVLGTEGVGQLLQPLGIGTLHEGVVAFAEGDAFLTQPSGQPLMAVEADPGVEREVRAQPQEHVATLRMLQVDVVDVRVAPHYIDPVVSVADRHLRWLTRLEDDRHAVSVAQILEVRPHPVVAAHVLGWFDHGDAQLPGFVFQPTVIVAGDLLQKASANLDLAAALKEGEDGLGDLQALNNDVAKHTIKAAVAKADRRAVMPFKTVHGGPPRGFARPMGEVHFIYCKHLAR